MSVSAKKQNSETIAMLAGAISGGVEAVSVWPFEVHAILFILDA